MYPSDPDGGLPPLPPKWSADPAAAQAGRDLNRALDELAGVPWPLAGVHDFDRADGQGRCRRPQCRVPFLDAGPECPGDELSRVDAEVAAITDEEVEARVAAAREDLARFLAGRPACTQPHPRGTHDQCPPGAPCHGGEPR